ncbi:MAG: tetratricopeptide repeat protein [Burkholderiaceae bacterium]|nr:tetratricopeptide repeat protein [Burkholderiaceae bacterium]
MFQNARSYLSTPLTVGLLVGALWAPLAHADDYAEVNRLIRAGQASDALSRADQYLASKPRDPQMRFLKGVILAESGKTNDAIALFTKLTEDYPELPEPYNNLAVLFAGQSQFDKARAALEMAIRTNPSYATAHENLGDVYAKLASQSYSKALQLDSANTGVPSKLALIRNLFAPDTRSGNRPATVAVAPTPPAPVAPARVSAAANTPPAAQAATPSAAAAATPAAKIPSSSPTPSDPAESADIVQAVRTWAKAWAAKDMAGYLGSYSAQFDPAGSLSRKAWEKERHNRIVTKNAISIDLSDFNIQASDTKATVTFRQNYRSGRLVSNSRKTLEMVKENNRWLITRESTG